MCQCQAGIGALVLVLVYAQNHALAVLRSLHGFNDDVVVIAGNKAHRLNRGTQSGENRLVQHFGLFHGVALFPCSGVRIQRVSEEVLLVVGIGVRLNAGFNQGQADFRLFHRVAVLAVVQQADAVAAFGNVHPLVAAALKACLIPAGVRMRFARNVAKLNVERCLVGMHIGRHKDFQQVLMLVPIHPCVKVNAAAVGIEADLLAHFGLHKVALDGQLGKQSADGSPLHGSDVGQIPAFFRVVHVNIPVIIVDGLIFKDAQTVAVLARFKDIALILFVKQGFHHTVFINANGIERGFHEVAAVFRLNGEGRLLFCGSTRFCTCHTFGRYGRNAAVHFAVGFLSSKAFQAADPFGQNCQVVAGKAEGVEQDNVASLTGNGFHLLVCQRLALSGNLCVLFAGYFVHFFDGRTGQNVVELVQEHHFPQFFQFFCGICCTLFLCQNRQQLHIAQCQLALAVRALIACHRGVSAAVILKVELTRPHRQTTAVLHALFQLGEVLQRTALTHLRHTLDAFFHTTAGFQHFTGRAAAAVTVTISDENIVIHFFVLITLPAAHDGVGVQHAVISSEELLHALADAQRRNEVRQNAASVNAFPHHGVIGNLVELVPGKLCRHEVINAALFHNLGQRTGITEYVRQPQHTVFHAELLTEEAFAVQELTHQALTSRQVAVGLEPHAAFRLPARLFDTLFELLIQLRIALVQEGIQHRLAGHKAVFGILLHHLQHSGEAAGGFLAGLRNRPPPSHVNVGVADAAGNHIVKAGHFAVDGLIQQVACLLYALIECLTGYAAHIQQVDRVVHGGAKVNVRFGLFVHAVQCPQGNLQVIVQVFHQLGTLLHVCHQAELGMQDAAVCLQVNHKALACLCAVNKGQLAVVHICALTHHTIDENEELRVLRIVPLFNLGAQIQPKLFSVVFFRHGELSAEPVVTVFAVPVVARGVKRLPRRLGVGICLGRSEVKCLFHLPAVQREGLHNNLFFELRSNDFDTFFCKNHKNPPE